MKLSMGQEDRWPLFARRPSTHTHTHIPEIRLGSNANIVARGMDRGVERGGVGGGGGVRSSSPLIASCDRQWRWCAKGLWRKTDRFVSSLLRYEIAMAMCDSSERLVCLLWLGSCSWKDEIGNRYAIY